MYENQIIYKNMDTLSSGWILFPKQEGSTHKKTKWPRQTKPKALL